jgi:hypothetical protein
MVAVSNKAYKLRKRREQEVPWSSGLSDRVYKILNSAEITSRQEVKELLGKGDYDAYLNSELGRLRNFGWKAWQELCVWAGLPCPNRPESAYYGWSCVWRNDMGEAGHCHGNLEALMLEALRHNAVSISFARDAQPEDSSSESFARKKRQKLLKKGVGN